MSHVRLDPNINVSAVQITDGSDTLAINSDGSISIKQYNTVQIISVDFSSTNLPASNAYLELDSSLNQDIKAIQVFDTGGNVMAIATGAAASEVDVCYIGPGSNEITPITIASGTRVSVKRVDSTTAGSSGFLVLNLLA